MHLFDETLKITDAVLSCLDFVDDSDDAPLQSIMTFAVRDGNDLSFVNLPIRLPNLAIR